MPNVIRETAYELRQPDGSLVATKHRRDFDDGTKSFFYRRASGELGLNSTHPSGLPLYRSECVGDSDWVVICEGEKAADHLASSGYPALGSAGSGSVPAVENLSFLRGKSVILWPDNDEVGRKHMRKFADRLHTLGIETAVVRVDDLPEKGDAADIADEAVIESYIKGAEEYVQSVLENESRPHVFNVQDMAKQAHRYATDQWDMVRDGKRLKLLWGFDRLDGMTDGVPKGIITIHGAPGAGKTSFALAAARAVAAPVIYVTTEMSPLELWHRLIAMSTGTPMRELKGATLSIEEIDALSERTLQSCSHINIIDASMQRVGIPYIEEVLREHRNLDDARHALLVVDSLHTWVDGFRIDDPDVSEYNAITEGITRLRDLANSLRISVILIAERNRNGMKDGGLSSVAGSRRVEYGSDLVIGLDKNDDQSDPHGVVKTIDLHVLKNRNGATGPVTFVFDGSRMEWSEQ